MNYSNKTTELAAWLLREIWGKAGHRKMFEHELEMISKHARYSGETPLQICLRITGIDAFAGPSHRSQTAQNYYRQHAQAVLNRVHDSTVKRS